MPVLFDSSVYITALRRGDAELLQGRWLGDSPVWLSSVVIEELYAGAKPGDLRILARLERDLSGANRTLTPNFKDWKRTGKVLARIGQKYGYEQIGRARLVNDALIAVSAARIGVTLITANQRDFAKLAEFCPLQWQARASSGG
jgi:predicted nucleic acid-binding protein